MIYITALFLASLGVSGLSLPAQAGQQGPDRPPVVSSTVQPAEATPGAGDDGASSVRGLAQALPPPADGSSVWSLGQPPRFKLYGSMLASGSRGIALFGAGRDLANPLTGILGWRVEGFAGASAKGAEGGARVLLTIPIARLHIGYDYDARTDKFERIMGFNFSVRRGGIFGRGSTLRIEWWSSHGQALHAGIQVPIDQRAGSTRPYFEHVRVPKPASKVRSSDRLAGVLKEFRATASDVQQVVSPLSDRWTGDASKAIAPDVAAVRRLPAPQEVFDRMMRAWTSVFAVALEGSGAPVTPELAKTVATVARHAVLDDVLLPYDALMGRRRTPDTLRSFTPQATKTLEAALSGRSDIDAAARQRAVEALAAAVEQLDVVRDEIRDDWGQRRKTFVPLQIALEQSEYDTQAEIDSLIERATGSRFSNGNRVYYVINERFQFEFERTVRRARRFHVLWIHDYRGKGDRGPVDLVGLAQTVTYLEALTARVREYDQTGSLPEYFVLLDEFFYESNAGRKWMSLLEDPLRNEVSLPAKYTEQERDLKTAQQALREAVAASKALQAGRAAHGDAWLHRLVSVHVNITNPADWSYWNSESVPIWGLPDNLFRDHRKIVFYDLSENDPYAGEAMFTGMGIGEKYASAEWEDRALIVQGPAALRAKMAVRDLLKVQGARPDDIPEVFRERPLGPDYEARVEAEVRRAEAAGSIPPARAMQTHNEVGFGYKRVSVTKLLLFSLLPPGSVVIAPDSMWESHIYASLLAGSALRGSRVLIITPATASSPVSSKLVQARTWMMMSRLLAFSHAMGDVMASRGGLLKVGLFNEKSSVNDMPSRIRELRARWLATGPWLQKLVPIDQAVFDTWESRAKDLASAPPPSYLVPPEKDARPMLHMKGVFIASAESWDGWFSHPKFGDVLLEYLRQRFRQVSGDRRAEVDVRELPNAVWPLRRELLAAHEASQTPEVRARRLYYLQIGSFNMNNRSMLIDGEAALTVSGPAALSGLIDFIMVSGFSTWPETQAQIDALIPRPKVTKRLMARWLRNII
jgi:hypothetical protein